MPEPEQTVIFHNAKFDLGVLARAGLPLPEKWEDTLIAAHLHDENIEHGLKELATSELGIAKPLTFKEANRDTLFDPHLFEEYARNDSRYTWRLWQGFEPRIDAEGLRKVYELEKAVVPVVRDMEKRGMKIDLALMDEMKPEVAAKCDRLRPEQATKSSHRLRRARPIFCRGISRPEPEPTIEPVSEPESEPKPASVLDFKLQEAPPPEKPERVTPEEIERMTSSDKREFLLAALRSGAVKDRNYTKLIIMAGLLDSGPPVKEIDLEDEALVEDIIVDWCNLIKPEQFAAVISALRDCKDDWRRTAIMDTMISRAFEQSRERVTTETEWRLEYECKLPIK